MEFGYFHELVETSGGSPFNGGISKNVFQSLDNAISQFITIQNSAENKKLPESMQLKVSFVRGDTEYSKQLKNLYDHDKMKNMTQEYKQEVIQKLKDIRENAKKDYNTLIQNSERAAEVDMEFIDEWEMDGKTLIALYKVMNAQKTTIETYQPYIKYAKHHWYKDVYFNSEGEKDGYGNPIKDSNGLAINVYDFPEFMSDKDFESYNPEGLASSEEVELLQEQGELMVQLKPTDGTTEVVQDAQPVIIKTEPWHYKVKNWLTSGYFFIYDGTKETAEKIEEARILLKEIGYDVSDPLLGVNGTEGLLTNDDTLKDKLGTNENGEIIIDVNANLKIEEIDKQAEYYNNFLKENGSPIRLQKINFAKKSSLEAFSILEAVHTKDAEYVYRDLKEFLIELGYFSRGDFDEIESGILDWMIPGFTPNSWPMPKYGDELYEYGNIIRYGVDNKTSSVSDFIETADKVYKNIIEHNIDYDESEDKDCTTFLSDNPGNGIVDSSTYVGAVLYEFDHEKYSLFTKQKNTTDWIENINDWKNKFDWTVIKQDGSITIDKLEQGDIILGKTENQQYKMEIFMEAEDSSKQNSPAYVNTCASDWWKNTEPINPLYKNCTSDMWTREGTYIIRLNYTKATSDTVTGEANATLGGPYDNWLDAAATVKAYVAENKYLYDQGVDPRYSKGICCACFVSWALYEYGYDNSNGGTLINYVPTLDEWLDANGFEKAFDGKAWSEEEANLQPGDIIIYGEDPSSRPHTGIYAGKNDKGEHIYYDCGATNKVQMMPGEDNISGPGGYYIKRVYRVPGQGSSAGITSLDNFLFIGDSRVHGIESDFETLGNNVKAIGVGSSTPKEWIEVAKNKTGNIRGTNITLPDNPKGISVALGVNGAGSETAAKSQLEDIKQVVNNLLATYPNTPIFVNSVYKVSTNYTYISAKDMNDSLDILNKGLSEFCSTNSMLFYIDIQSNLNDSNGYLKVEYGGADGLHIFSGEGKDILLSNTKEAILKEGKSLAKKEKPNGFEADMDVVCPGECKVLSVSEQSIKLKFGVQSTSYNKNLINGYTLYVEGFQVDTVNITEGMSLKRGDVMGVTLRQDIKLILMDDKKAILNNIEDYMKPDEGKGSSSGGIEGELSDIATFILTFEGGMDVNAEGDYWIVTRDISYPGDPNAYTAGGSGVTNYCEKEFKETGHGDLWPMKVGDRVLKTDILEVKAAVIKNTYNELESLLSSYGITDWTEYQKHAFISLMYNGFGGKRNGVLEAWARGDVKGAQTVWLDCYNRDNCAYGHQRRRSVEWDLFINGTGYEVTEERISECYSKYYERGELK